MWLYGMLPLQVANFAKQHTSYVFCITYDPYEPQQKSTPAAAGALYAFSSFEEVRRNYPSLFK